MYRRLGCCSLNQHHRLFLLKKLASETVVLQFKLASKSIYALQKLAGGDGGDGGASASCWGPATNQPTAMQVEKKTFWRGGLPPQEKSCFWSCWGWGTKPFLTHFALNNTDFIGGNNTCYDFMTFIFSFTYKICPYQCCNGERKQFHWILRQIGMYSTVQYCTVQYCTVHCTVFVNKKKIYFLFSKTLTIHHMWSQIVSGIGFIYSWGWIPYSHHPWWLAGTIEEG